ncbi:hypothetical protein ACM66B_001789 [Microbotryomycetes sp. NB124-2]
MDDCGFCFVCIGCSKRLSQEGDGQARVCPRCHNAAVTAAKSTNCLELFCVPVLPMGSSHIWLCGICQWQCDQKGPAPPLPQQPLPQQPLPQQPLPQQPQWGQFQPYGGAGYGPPQQGYAGQPGMMQPPPQQYLASQQPYQPGYNPNYR